MTRENLVDAIYSNTSEWSCTHDCVDDIDCKVCCDNQLKKYEDKIGKEKQNEIIERIVTDLLHNPLVTIDKFNLIEDLERLKG